MTVFLPKGQVWKRVWILEVSPKNGFGKMTLFWSEIENQTAQPHQEFSGVPFPLKSFQRSLPWCAWFEGHMKSRLWFKLSTPMHRDLIPRSPEDSDYQIPPPPPRDGEYVKCRGIWPIQSCPLYTNLSITSLDLSWSTGALLREGILRNYHASLPKRSNERRENHFLTCQQW